MLHELLLSLIGKPGQIIIQAEGCFKIDPYIDFVSEPEKDILNKICMLGYHYCKIERFLDENHKIFSDISLQLITDARNGEEAENVTDRTNPIGNSAYVKAFCYGVEEIMEEYREKILEIERGFLKERTFTLASLSVKLSDYFYILPDIDFLIEKIMSDNCIGGQVIDLLQMRLLTGHIVLQNMYKRILKYVYKVLFHQIIAWIVYGRLLDFYNEFFIYRVENKKVDSLNKAFNIQFKENKPDNVNVASEKLDQTSKGHELEADWDSVFSLRFSMLPQTVLSIKLAENILFIGKAQRVLQAKNKSLKNFSIESMKILQELSSADIIDTLLFQNTIEKIRFDVAQKMMELILKEEKLIDHLTNLKDFYFLAKGEFYQIFIEESRNIMKLPPTSNAEHEINGVAYQNSILRLNWDESQLLKDVKFKINNNGFEFNQFQTLYGLNIVGNVSQKKNNNYIRFEQMKTSKEGGCMWYNLKQSVENGFKMSFSVRFKRAIASQLQEIAKRPLANLSMRQPVSSDNASPYKMQLESPKVSIPKEDGSSQTTICIVIQNEKEISSWKKNAPSKLEDLNEYIAIKINLLDTSNKMAMNFSNESYVSSIGVYYFSKEQGFKLNNLFQEKIGAAPAHNFIKEKKLGEVVFNKEDVNFAEEDLHLLKINYDGENLLILKDDYRPAMKNSDQAMETENYCLKVPLKLSQLINLDMGRAYVGFVQESQNSRFFIDVLSWKMLGYNIYNSEDTWSGLTVAYNVKWPLNLFLSSQVMEKYSNIFRFLFPIRSIQLELHRTWQYLIKKTNTKVTKKSRMDDFERIYIRVLHLRNKMSFFVDNLWSYFHVDVLGTQWAKLEESLAQAKDFDEMRKVHDMYLTSISSHTFLNFPKMVKGIYTVVQYCRALVNLVSRAEIDLTVEEMRMEYTKIDKEYEQAVADMLGILTILNKTHSSSYLYQLLLKLDYNGYYSFITNQPAL